MKAQNEEFKTWFVQLPVIRAITIKDMIREQCGWNRHVWFNKLHGRTAITLAERNVINSITSLQDIPQIQWPAETANP